MSALERRTNILAPVIANGAALSEVIDVRPYAGGVLSMPAAWTAAKIGIQHCATPTGTFQPLYTTDADAETLVELTVSASREYVLPDAVYACAYIKLWSESAGVNVNQGAARTFALTLKG